MSTSTNNELLLSEDYTTVFSSPTIELTYDSNVVTTLENNKAHNLKLSHPKLKVALFDVPGYVNKSSAYVNSMFTPAKI